MPSWVDIGRPPGRVGGARGRLAFTALTALAAAAAAAAAAQVAGCSGDVSAGRVDRCALGVHLNADGGDAEAGLVALEDEVGRGFTIDRRYHHWDDAFPTDSERQSAAAGRTLLLSFSGLLRSGEMRSFAEVADPANHQVAGELAAMAARVRDLGQPVLLIYHDEAQNDTGFGSAAEFVAAWRRVVTSFRDAGADNAVWVWSLSSGGYPSQADDWYPGDDVVDWIGSSGFNWYNGDPSSPWRTFSSVFSSFREWSQPKGKPLIIVSMASAENPTVDDSAPRSKATWIREMDDSVRDWPALQAVVWFQGTDSGQPYHDWRVDSSPAALDAFRQLAADPHFDVTGQTPP